MIDLHMHCIRLSEVIFTGKQDVKLYWEILVPYPIS